MKKKTAKTRNARKKSVRTPRKKKTNTKYGALGLLTDEVKNNIKKSFNDIVDLPPPQTTGYQIPIKTNDKFVFVNPGTGCRSEYTGQEMLQLFKYKDEINSLHKKLSEREAVISNLKRGIQPPIPDIPKEEVDHWADDILSMVKESTRPDAVLECFVKAVKEEFPQKDLKGVLKKLIEFRNQYDKAIDSANKALDIQGADGNWNHDPYMFGMFNGMEYMLATFEDREVRYRNAPTKWKDPRAQDTPTIKREEETMTGKMMVDAREKSPAELVNDLVSNLHGREDIIPMILQDVNTILINRVRDIAERAGETSANAKKRFEECVHLMNAFAKK
jgi:hypothetical protein